MISPGFDVEPVARQIGAQGVDKLVMDAERVSSYEEERIVHENAPEIVRLQAEFAIQLAEERRLNERLASAPAHGDLRRLRLRGTFCWAVVAILAVTGFFSTMLSLAPFRLGWMSWLVSAGMALLTPFLVDRLLENPGMGSVLKVLTVVAGGASLASLMLLAHIRGDILGEQIRATQAQAVVIDDTQPQQEAPNTFYDKAVGLLSVALFLMAFATEIGGGLALHDAWRSMPDESEDWPALGRELVATRRRMAAMAGEITRIREAPKLFASRFRRDFYLALLLSATRKALSKLLLIILAFAAFASRSAQAQDRLNLVVAIDLTRSVASVGPDGKTDYEKNVEGVSRVFAQVPAGSRLTVIGITDRSFAQPYILMQALVPDDSGYFGERLDAAHAQLVRAWRARAAHLSPYFKQTDIFGALELASQLFARDPSANRKQLVIFSDMRESASAVDFEREQLVPAFAAIANKCGKMPALPGVQLYVAGVDGVGKSTVYWQSLSSFWTEYLRNSGAFLAGFTVLREVRFTSIATLGP